MIAIFIFQMHKVLYMMLEIALHPFHHNFKKVFELQQIIEIYDVENV